MYNYVCKTSHVGFWDPSPKPVSDTQSDTRMMNGIAAGRLAEDRGPVRIIGSLTRMCYSSLIRVCAPWRRGL